MTKANAAGPAENTQVVSLASEGAAALAIGRRAPVLQEADKRQQEVAARSDKYQTAKADFAAEQRRTRRSDDRS